VCYRVAKLFNRIYGLYKSPPRALWSLMGFTQHPMTQRYMSWLFPAIKYM